MRRLASFVRCRRPIHCDLGTMLLLCVILYIQANTTSVRDAIMPEWLRGWPRKPLGSARACSNHVDCDHPFARATCVSEHAAVLRCALVEFDPRESLCVRGYCCELGYVPMLRCLIAEGSPFRTCELPVHLLSCAASQARDTVPSCTASTHARSSSDAQVARHCRCTAASAGRRAGLRDSIATMLVPRGPSFARTSGASVSHGRGASPRSCAVTALTCTFTPITWHCNIK